LRWLIAETKCAVPPNLPLGGYYLNKDHRPLRKSARGRGAVATESLFGEFQQNRASDVEARKARVAFQQARVRMGELLRLDSLRRAGQPFAPRGFARRSAHSSTINRNAITARRSLLPNVTLIRGLSPTSLRRCYSRNSTIRGHSNELSFGKTNIYDTPERERRGNAHHSEVNGTSEYRNNCAVLRCLRRDDAECG